MVEEGFAFVIGVKGVDGREEGKVEREKMRVGGVSSFLEQRQSTLSLHGNDHWYGCF